MVPIKFVSSSSSGSKIQASAPVSLPPDAQQSNMSPPAQTPKGTEKSPTVLVAGVGNMQQVPPPGWMMVPIPTAQHQPTMMMQPRPVMIAQYPQQFQQCQPQFQPQFQPQYHPQFQPQGPIMIVQPQHNFCGPMMPAQFVQPQMQFITPNPQYMQFPVQYPYAFHG